MTKDEKLAKIESMDKELAYIKKQYPETFEYHMHGKIETRGQHSIKTKRDLSLAYSPGVALPCAEIYRNEDNVYEYTSKGNLVAVISNGTAVLGLGNLGALASKPVLEGKAVLLKKFADINSFDIEVDETDPDKFIEVVKAISPTFGGIKLEDIKAPECFTIETRLDRELNIPVMHDDQHGTAMVSTAGIINGAYVSNKKLKDLKIVIYGAGAAAMGCAKLYKELGVEHDNIIMFDSKGAITNRRDDLNEYKQEFAVDRDVKDIYTALEDADALIGLSVSNSIPTDAILKMAHTPIIFALANPTPEIDVNEAAKLRRDAIIGTGRSDFPNQINNLLAFPYIFKGALYVKSKRINYAMKVAAAKAIAAVAREPALLEIKKIHYSDLKFGKDYIIPSTFDPRLVTKVSEAVAKAAIDSGVARVSGTTYHHH